MGLTALLLTARAALGADTVPPYLTFPEAGLDDPAAYQGYETRVYRDGRRNAFQVYLDRRRGRVVHLWADAANESGGPTARESPGRPGALSWGATGAVVTASGANRSVAYRLEAGTPVRLGLFLPGSMRGGRGVGFGAPGSLPLAAGGGAAPPRPPEAARAGPHDGPERRCLEGAGRAAELRRPEPPGPGAGGRCRRDRGDPRREDRHPPFPGRRAGAVPGAGDHRRAGAHPPLPRGDLPRRLSPPSRSDERRGGGE